jgi:hypothetical protein
VSKDDHEQHEQVERTIAERKVLATAMEEGPVWELLPASSVISKDGPLQHYPELPMSVAQRTLARLITAGLIGTYELHGEEEFTGEAALSSVTDPEVWKNAAGGGPCLFLTAAGQQAITAPGQE